MHPGGDLRAPFPWFGGKRRVAAEVWARFGKVKNYVEPFFGSGAVLLGRPEPFGVETVNDLDGFVANFWRAIKFNPQRVAAWADNPVNENDLHARHVWLLQHRESLRAKLEGDPEWHDPQIAGFWVWGLSCWIGSGFCSGKGPWWPDDDRKLVHLGNSGRGVMRQSVRGAVVAWFNVLSERLLNVRVCSGDWTRVCGSCVTFGHGLTGVFLDPPYSVSNRRGDIYREDSLEISRAVREWAVANGDNPKMRIALCGYEGEHEMPPTWNVHSWSAAGGYASRNNNNNNNTRERIWFSPACVVK